MSSLAPSAPVVKRVPPLAASKVRQDHMTHVAFCRHCRQGLVCSLEFDLRARINRLEGNRGDE